MITVQPRGPGLRCALPAPGDMTCVTPKSGNRHTADHHQHETSAPESARQNRYTGPLHTASADRRHVFATDLVNNGLPIHIGAAASMSTLAFAARCCRSTPRCCPDGARRPMTLSRLSEGAVDHAPRVLAASPADHNSATSGIAPLGTTDLSADRRDSQLPRPADILAGLLTVRDSGRKTGSQARAGLRAAKSLLGGRNIRRSVWPLLQARCERCPLR